jgi:hypothetical protein
MNASCCCISGTPTSVRSSRIFPSFRAIPSLLRRNPAAAWIGSVSRNTKLYLIRQKLHSQADWEVAGKLVFEDPYPASISIEKFGDPRWYADLNIPRSFEGIVLSCRYLILKRGEVKAGTANCAACHSRVMPDGSLIHGPRPTFP